MNQPFVVFKRPKRHKPPPNDASRGGSLQGFLSPVRQLPSSEMELPFCQRTLPLLVSLTSVFPVYCTSFLAANPKYLFCLTSFVRDEPVALQHTASFLTRNTCSVGATISRQHSYAHHIEIIQDSSTSIGGMQHGKDIQSAVPHSEELRTPILESAWILAAVLPGCCWRSCLRQLHSLEREQTG